MPLQPSPPIPAPPAIERRTAPPPRRWRSCPGARPCHRGTPAPYRVWAQPGRACRGTRRSSPSCCQPRAASASPPSPAGARSSSTFGQLD
eukprot:scaffold84493_cov63-Phaeocystis_antarctica.AAC.6